MMSVFSWSGLKNAWSRLLAFVVVVVVQPLTESTRNPWEILPAGSTFSPSLPSSRKKHSCHSTVHSASPPSDHAL